jgi:hypothetical protein
MRYVIGMSELLIGLAYTGLGLLTWYEMHHERASRGRSQFGIAFALMAFTCGPHHLLRAGETFSTPGGTSAAALVALLIGLPPGLVFVGLRIEALRGGEGDRRVRIPTFAPLLVVVVAVASGAIIASELYRHIAIDLPFAISNAILIASYFAVGWFILNTQFRRYSTSHTWSLSGVALGFVFPTCALTHATHLLALHAHDVRVHTLTHVVAGHVHRVAVVDAGATTIWAHLLVLLDIAGLPASIWFLVVVRRLHHQGRADWNRRPLVSSGLTPGRAAPWQPASVR